MPEELDESWVEDAIAARRDAERLRAAFTARLNAAEVSVRSPDELVEVLVRADGSISRVNVSEPVRGYTGAELGRAVTATVAAAAEAARWARRTVYAEIATRAALADPPPPSLPPPVDR